jgi:hypothetical protein
MPSPDPVATPAMAGIGNPSQQEKLNSCRRIGQFYQSGRSALIHQIGPTSPVPVSELRQKHTHNGGCMMISLVTRSGDDGIFAPSYASEARQSAMWTKSEHQIPCRSLWCVLETCRRTHDRFGGSALFRCPDSRRNAGIDKCHFWGSECCGCCCAPGWRMSSSW